MLTGGKSTTFTKLLQYYENVWKNNIDNDTSFNSDIDFQINKALKQPNTALYWITYELKNRIRRMENKNECQVNLLKMFNVFVTIFLNSTRKCNLKV